MNNKGFTLIEIVVAIGLLALVGTISTVSFIRISKEAKVREYNNLVSEIESATLAYLTVISKGEEAEDNEKDIAKLYLASLNDDSNYIDVYLYQLSNKNLINKELYNSVNNRKISLNNSKMRVKLSSEKDLEYEFLVSYE